jgi:hypothetical protein
MIIDKEFIDFHPCYDKDEKYIGSSFNDGETVPAEEYVSFSVSVTEEVYDKKYKKILAFNSTWSEDLVLALHGKTKFNLQECILIASRACERCMNSLAHQYGLDWGYPEYSDEWFETNTSCKLCNKSEHTFNHNRPLRTPIDDRDVKVKNDLFVVDTDGNRIEVDSITITTAKNETVCKINKKYDIILQNENKEEETNELQTN